jgi:hypothetical protein
MSAFMQRRNVMNMRIAATRIPVSIVAAILPSLVGAIPEVEPEARERHAPFLVPLWVAIGIAGGAMLLPLYGHEAAMLPALAFLVICPLLVAGVLLMEGDDIDAGS